MIAAVKWSLGAAAALTTLSVSAALALPAAAPAAALAVTEELPGFDHVSQLNFVAASDESNRVTLAIYGAKDGYLTLEVRDEGAPLSAGTGCSGGGHPGQPALCRLHEVVAHQLCLHGCPSPQYGENWRVSIAVDLGAGDNSLLASDLAPEEPIPILVTSGPGDDLIDTATGDDAVDSGAGSDVVRTGLGSDRVKATVAPDGPDFYDLGENPPGVRDFDELSYRDRFAPVAVRADQGGAEGEGDELLGVETLVGGSGNDLLVGDGGIRRLEGGGGADVLLGGQQGNRIFGGEGDDLLVGGPKGDELRERRKGDSGNDVARGMGGRDRIVLGSGKDRIFAGRGDDRVQGGPGHDSIGCGPGQGDTVTVPAGDTLRNCEWAILNYFN